jgi:GMP synthase-like glutamine amidotransferase
MAITKTIKMNYNPYKQQVDVAILDLNEGHVNQSMRCIREILETFAKEHQLYMKVSEFDVRLKNELPDISDFDIFISSGGPGSPFDGAGKEWEERYFGFLDQIWNHNLAHNHKKNLFLICHSFQMACRFFKIGEVIPRKSQAFGVFAVHKTTDGETEPFFHQLNDPFYGVDSRDWQVVQPAYDQLDQLGAQIVAIEKERPHVPLERCIMAARISNEIFGTQFHPEADAEGMRAYLMTEEKKKLIINNHGIEKYEQMLIDIDDPSKLSFTQSHIIPAFLKKSIFTQVAATV